MTEPTRRRTLRELVEDAIQDAYEIGHAHGRAPFLEARGEKPKRNDEGWLMPANRLIRQLKRRGAK